MNNVIPLALVNPPPPVEDAPSAPHQRTNLEVLEAELLPEFTPQSVFDSLASLESATWSDPKTVISESVSQEKYLLLRGQKYGSDHLALDGQWSCLSGFKGDRSLALTALELISSFFSFFVHDYLLSFASQRLTAVTKSCRRAYRAYSNRTSSDALRCPPVARYSAIAAVLLAFVTTNNTRAPFCRPTRLSSSMRALATPCR